MQIIFAESLVLSFYHRCHDDVRIKGPLHFEILQKKKHFQAIIVFLRFFLSISCYEKYKKIS